MYNIITFPGLASVDSILDGVRTDALRMAVEEYGHSMPFFRGTTSTCRHCRYIVEVYVAHRFEGQPLRIVYRGNALQERCHDPKSRLVLRNVSGLATL